jgi:hypothetical protein
VTHPKCGEDFLGGGILPLVTLNKKGGGGGGGGFFWEF